MRLASGLALALLPAAASAVSLTVNGVHADILVGANNCSTLQLRANWDLGQPPLASTDSVIVMGVRSATTCSTASPSPELFIDGPFNPTAQTGFSTTTASAMAFSGDAGVSGCSNPDLLARRSSNPLTNILCVQYATGGVIATDQVNVKYALAPPLAPINVSVLPGDRLLKVSWAKGDNADDIATYDVHVFPAGTTPDGGVAANVTSLNTSVEQTDSKSPLQNGILYSVTVVANDKYGNISDASVEAQGTPVPSDDFWEHYRNSNGSAEGGCATGNGSAFIAAGAALLALLLRRRRKASGGAALVALLAVSGAARADEAERVRPRFLLGFKLDRYDPKVDSEPGLTRHPYHDIFGTRAPGRFQVEFDWEVAHPFGSILLGVTAGFWQNYGKAILSGGDPNNPQKSQDTTVLNVWPFGFVATYRFDYLHERWQRVPIIPYVQAGLMRALWVSYDGRGGVSYDSTSKRGQGWTNGYTTALGIALSLNSVDPQLAREAYLDTGIQRTSIFAEYGWTYLSNYHKPGALILSDHAWRFGLALEF